MDKKTMKKAVRLALRYCKVMENILVYEYYDAISAIGYSVYLYFVIDEIMNHSRVLVRELLEYDEINAASLATDILLFSYGLA